MISILFVFILIQTRLIALSTNRWFQLWVSLEINIIAFIPLIYNNDNLSINRILKYFLIQSIGSSLFILTSILSYELFLRTIHNNLIILALTIKLGIFPIFFWLPQVREGLSWIRFTLLATWQKIIPLYIISIRHKTIFTLIISITIVTSCLGALRQTSLRKIFAYSSIAHLGWILTSMLNNNNNYITYFLVYSLIIATIYLTIINNKATSIRTIKFLNNDIEFIIVRLSLRGLPPLLGFLPKLLLLAHYKGPILLLILLIGCSLLLTLIYLRIFVPLIFIVKKIEKNKYKTQKNISFTTNTLILIPIIPLILF